MARKRCVHKYYRINLGYADVYACALPTCTHYMPKHLEVTLLGKQAICWFCENKFILDERALRMEKPVCLQCALGESKSEDELPVSDELQAYLDKLKVV